MADNKQEMIEKIEDAIKQLRPYMEADGGDMTFVELTDDMIARVKLHGACSSCSMSMMTLKAGVEEAVRRVVPQVKSVEAVDI